MARSLDGFTDRQLNDILEGGFVFARCPGCDHHEWVSPDDPDGSFSTLLSHIGYEHPEIDRRPEKLWPRIKYVEDKHR